MNVLYRTQATATGGRTGAASTADGAFSVKLVTPKELGGPGGEGNNPEQLFAAGWAGCFHSSLKVVARGEGITLTDSTVTVEVGLNKADGAFSLAAAIVAHLPGVEQDKAEHLLAQAHQRCPYSKATRGNIDVKLTLS